MSADTHLAGLRRPWSNWQTDEFWRHALFAAVAYMRTAASRAGAPVRQACRDLAQRHNDHFLTHS